MSKIRDAIKVLYNVVVYLEDYEEMKVVLIFWGVLIAAVAMAVPFILSLVFVLALTAAGFFVFCWEYVWFGTILFLILIGMALE